LTGKLSIDRRGEERRVWRGKGGFDAAGLLHIQTGGALPVNTLKRNDLGKGKGGSMEWSNGIRVRDRQWTKKEKVGWLGREAVVY